MSNDTRSMRCYVSYAWADEANPDREAQVDALVDEARRKGLDIVRDKDALKAGDRISEFMRKIGGGDRVFVFLSHKYLTSPFCMNELFLIWRNSREDEADFLERVRVYKLDDARFEQFEDRLSCAKYWRSEHDRLEEIIKSSLSEVSDFDYKRFRLMDQFATNIGDILALFSDTVRPRSFEEFLKYGFEDASPTGREPAPAQAPSSGPTPPTPPTHVEPPLEKGAGEGPRPLANEPLSKPVQAWESPPQPPPDRRVGSKWPLALTALLVLALAGAGVRYFAMKEPTPPAPVPTPQPSANEAWCYQVLQKNGAYYLGCNKLQADCETSKALKNDLLRGTGCEPVDLSKTQCCAGGFFGQFIQTASAPFPKPFPQIVEMQPPPPTIASGYGIVFGGDTSIPAAMDEVSKVTAPPISARVIIFFREKSYRSVTYFDTAEDATAGLAKIKSIKPGAYQVTLSTWCPKYTVDAATNTHVEVRTCTN